MAFYVTNRIRQFGAGFCFFGWFCLFVYLVGWGFLVVFIERVLSESFHTSEAFFEAKFFCTFHTLY